MSDTLLTKWRGDSCLSCHVALHEEDVTVRAPAAQIFRQVRVVMVDTHFRVHAQPLAHHLNLSDITS